MLERENLYILFLLLLVSTLVIADPESNVNINSIDKELTELNVLYILNEKGWREEDTNEGEWRKPRDDGESNVRWGGYSILEKDEREPGFISNENEVDTAIDSREATSQFKLRF